jgi:hypothetical protein
MFNKTQFTRSTNWGMFRHQNAFFKEFTNTGEQKFNIPLKELFALAVIFEILIYFNFNVTLC